jgi:hypothetical protein
MAARQAAAPTTLPNQFKALNHAVPQRHKPIDPQCGSDDAVFRLSVTGGDVLCLAIEGRNIRGILEFGDDPYPHIIASAIAMWPSKPRSAAIVR